MAEFQLFIIKVKRKLRGPAITDGTLVNTESVSIPLAFVVVIAAKGTRVKAGRRSKLQMNAGKMIPHELGKRRSAELSAPSALFSMDK